MIPIDLYKQEALDVDPEAIQQINFTGDLDRQGNTTKKLLWIFHKEPWEYQNKVSHYNNVNVKLSFSQLNKLKLRIKNSTEVTLDLSSKVDSNFPRKWLLTER